MPMQKRQCSCHGDSLVEQVNFYWLHFWPKGVCRIDLNPLFEPAKKKRHIYWYGICPTCCELMKYRYEFAGQNTVGIQLLLDTIKAIKDEELFGHKFQLTNLEILKQIKPFLPYSQSVKELFQSIYRSGEKGKKEKKYV